jgi:hypothetical protein
MYDLIWGSHLPVLMKVASLTTGDILELGAGFFSTPYLFWICKEQKRKFVSYENEYEWFKQIWRWKNPKGSKVTTDKLSVISPDKLLEYHFVSSWDMADIDKEWDVVLVDHSPSQRRIVEIKKLANLAKYIVVHDTQRDTKFCDYPQIYSLFKYRYDYSKAIPYTTVLSNFMDLSNL